MSVGNLMKQGENLPYTAEFSMSSSYNHDLCVRRSFGKSFGPQIWIRVVTITGSIISAMGFILSTFSPDIWMMVLTFGIMAGQYMVSSV